MEEFRSVMTTLGEKLSHSDVDEMMTMTGIGKNGKVKYKGMFWFNKQRLRSHNKLLLLKGVLKSSSYQKSCVQYLEPGYM